MFYRLLTAPLMRTDAQCHFQVCPPSGGSLLSPSAQCFEVAGFLFGGEGPGLYKDVSRGDRTVGEEMQF